MRLYRVIWCSWVKCICVHIKMTLNNVTMCVSYYFVAMKGAQSLRYPGTNVIGVDRSRLKALFSFIPFWWCDINILKTHFSHITPAYFASKQQVSTCATTCSLLNESAVGISHCCLMNESVPGVDQFDRHNSLSWRPRRIIILDVVAIDFCT